MEQFIGGAPKKRPDMALARPQFTRWTTSSSLETSMTIIILLKIHRKYILIAGSEPVEFILSQRGNRWVKDRLGYIYMLKGTFKDGTSRQQWRCRCVYPAKGSCRATIQTLNDVVVSHGLANHNHFPWNACISWWIHMGSMQLHIAVDVTVHVLHNALIENT